MATIIEVQDTKLDNLSEYVEKMINYGGKVMRCIEEMQSKDYNEKYGRRRYLGKSIVTLIIIDISNYETSFRYLRRYA